MTTLIYKQPSLSYGQPQLHKNDKHLVLLVLLAVLMALGMVIFSSLPVLEFPRDGSGSAKNSHPTILHNDLSNIAFSGMM